MNKQHWMELQAEAPFAVSVCLHYFQDRYIGQWQSKVLDSSLLIAYLKAKGFAITVSTFGIPNRNDWYFEIFTNTKLFEHQRDFSSYDAAFVQAVTCVFQELEKQLNF